MAYLKGIVMQQLRKTAWNDSDALKIGQIGIKLAADSKTVLEVRIGTVEETWAKGQKIALESYFSNYATTEELNSAVGTLEDAIEAEANARKAADEALGGRIDGVSGEVSQIQTNLEVQLYGIDSSTKVVDVIDAKVKVEKERAEGAEEELRTSIQPILELGIADNYATKAYADQAEADAKKYTDDQLVDYMTADEAGQESIRLGGLITAEAKAREAADNALSGRVKAVEDWKGTISNVMDFAGTVETLPTSVAGYDKGDVILVTSTSKEYVNDGKNWVEFGVGSANEAAIAGLQGRMTTAEGEIDAIQAKVAGWDTTKQTVDANKATWDKAGTALQPADIVELENTVSQHESRFDNYVLGSTYATDKAKFALKTEVEAEARERSNEDAALGRRIDAITLANLGGVDEDQAGNIAQTKVEAYAYSKAETEQKIGAATVDLATNAALSDVQVLANTKVASVTATEEAGIVVNNTDAKNPTVGLENLNMAKDLGFYVFKVDKFGRIIQAEEITVLDGNKGE